MPPPPGPLRMPSEGRRCSPAGPKGLQAANRLLRKGAHKTVSLQGLDLLTAFYLRPRVRVFLREELHRKLMVNLPGVRQQPGFPLGRKRMVTWQLWMVIAPDRMPQHQVPPASITAEGKGVKGEEKVHLWHWS